MNRKKTLKINYKKQKYTQWMRKISSITFHLDGLCRKNETWSYSQLTSWLQVKFILNRIDTWDHSCSYYGNCKVWTIISILFKKRIQAIIEDFQTFLFHCLVFRVGYFSLWSGFLGVFFVWLFLGFFVKSKSTNPWAHDLWPQHQWQSCMLSKAEKLAPTIKMLFEHYS